MDFVKVKDINFIGRNYEKECLVKAERAKNATIVIIYGRRRIGKTELIHQHFKHRNLLKFEGIENAIETVQFATCVQQLMEYTHDAKLKNVVVTRWLDFFNLIYEYIKNKKITLYFEELQWLSGYNSAFVAELKYAWDNKFKNNNNLILVLCGSSPSFMINEVLHSKALYNRSEFEVAVQEFSLQETHQFLGAHKSKQETLDAYLTVGGIPEYLKYLKTDSSVFISLCNNSFKPNGFFVNEYERIFISSLSKNPHYKKIINLLSLKKSATREEILKHISIDTGGTITKLLLDLEVCGFIESNVPLGQKSQKYGQKYSISDKYIHFYNKFILPERSRVMGGDFQKASTKALKLDSYRQFLGMSFERFCRKESNKIAEVLGFGGVKYTRGMYFQKGSPGTQLDLIYNRDDRVYTICEIKYSHAPVDSGVITEFEQKLKIFNAKKYSIHKVLITVNGAESSLKNKHYFDDILDIDSFFD